jgi:predicted RNA binding protein YcfA (HicA-like mRNA interferase family)
MAGGRLPVASGKDVLRALRSAGFVIDRIVGSHHVMVFPGDLTRTVVVPVHGNRDLKPGTLRSIIRQAGLTVDDFARLLSPTLRRDA